MLFQTHEERERFMDDIYTVPAGAAMAHVRATHLGVWGNEYSLKLDAARIMFRELRGVLVALSVPYRTVEYEKMEVGNCIITVGHVVTSRAFVEGFERARGRNRNYTAGVLEDIAGSNMNRDLKAAVNEMRASNPEELHFNKRLVLMMDREPEREGPPRDDRIVYLVARDLGLIP
jgi:hypothetical protein